MCSGDKGMPKEFGGIALKQIQHLFETGTVIGLSDRQLLQRFALNRDEVAFTALVDRHGPMVLGVCRRIIADPHEAEDVFQAAFLVLVRKAGSIRVDDSLGRWLYTVTRRLALRAGADLDRRNRRTVAPIDVNDDRPSDEHERREMAIAVHDELDSLPKPYRNVVMLCYLDGLTHEEAARRLCWPLGSVKGRLVRAKKLLHSRLTRRGLAVSSGTLAVVFRPNPVSASLLERTVSAAIGFAAGRAAVIPAATLANGVLKTMFLSKLKFSAMALLVICVGAYTTGAAGDGGRDKVAAKQENPAAKANSPDSKTEFDINITYPVKAASNHASGVDELKTLDDQEADYRKSLAASEDEIAAATQRLDELKVAVRSAERSLLISTDRTQRFHKALDQIQTRRDAIKKEMKSVIEPSDFKVVPVQDQPVVSAPVKAPLPREGAMRISPVYKVEPSDVLVVEVLEALPGRPIKGKHLIRPDGKISLGFYDEVSVAGLNLMQVKEKIVTHLREYLTDRALGLRTFDEETQKNIDVPPSRTHYVFVDIAEFNSKAYYVQGAVGSPGRFTITGHDTVLDGINRAGGLQLASIGAKIRLIRPASEFNHKEQTLGVDLREIVEKGESTTNYQLLAGDRLIVYPEVPLTPTVPASTTPTVPTKPADRPTSEARIDALMKELADLKKELGK